MPVTRKNATALVETKETENQCDNNNDKVLLLLNKLDSKIDKNHNDIGVKIEQQSVNLRDEISKNIRELESKMDDKLQSSLSCHSSQIGKIIGTMDNNDRLAKLNDVLLRGIPTTMNESLISIFDQIATTIGFGAKRSAVNNIFRFGTETNAPILVKFLSLLFKREFMTQYFAHRELKLSDIDVESQNRIYASDNLTKANYEIQQKAVKMLKEKLISKINIRSGLVYVKFKEGSDFVKIIHSDDLTR